MGEGGHIIFNASLSQPNVQKKQQSPCEGEGGLKFEKKMRKKTIKPTPRKKLGIGSPVFCTFSFTQTP